MKPYKCGKTHLASNGFQLPYIFALFLASHLAFSRVLKESVGAKCSVELPQSRLLHLGRFLAVLDFAHLGGKQFSFRHKNW